MSARGSRGSAPGSSSEGAGGTPPLRNDLFLRACRRESVERTPVWIMRQAGRYLPEYRALRERVGFLESCRTPEIACEITLQPIRRLGVDAAILFSDILIPLPGMGVPVEFNPGPCIETPIRTAAAIEALRVPDPKESTGFVMDAVRLVRAELAGSVPLIGFAGAPFTLATYLVEGGASKSFSAIKSLLLSDPPLAHRLLETCARTTASYLSAQVEAGAQAAMLFDTWAGILSPEDYRTFALPYARRVFETIAADSRRATAGRGGSKEPSPPLIYYAGDAAGHLEMLKETSADVIGLDWRLGLDEARARLGSDLALQGNLDPVVLLASPSVIAERAALVIRQAGAVGHVFNLGHGILPETPPEHALFLIEKVRELSTRQAG